MTTRTPITEEFGIHKEWFEQAKQQTLDTLPEFLRRLSQDYDHDYGTICHALGAAALAAAWAMNATEQGGITGFQSGAVMWDFIQEWTHRKDAPLQLVDYNDLLYPQYDHKFKAIPASAWKYAQEKAAENLKEGRGYPNVIEHWQSIVDGVVPFGLTVEA